MKLLKIHRIHTIYTGLRHRYQKKYCNRSRHHCTSHTKNVSKLHGESFHFSPLPSRFHNSIQFSSSPFSYRKLLGSPAFQLVNVIGRPFAIQKKLPSSAKSVPDVQKCSFPNPKETNKCFTLANRMSDGLYLVHMCDTNGRSRILVHYFNIMFCFPLT